jgi:transcriptional regulator with XRE-family HTH domain
MEKKLKQIVIEKGFTPTTFAAALGVKQPRVYEIFQSKDLTIDMSQRICGVLGIALEDLADGLEEGGGKPITLLGARKVSRLLGIPMEELIGRLEGGQEKHQ